ncbi:MAG: bifunctional precorrin-2 dehydrogenase/sirohydrochlorin ferrochelatase [Lachnospiraceae bacterium]|nr:bifunctional precorrin-2 dehydrogenase/sirohydrochlorin ferrochelatase [Lachnospiraceae bacterium]
MHRKFPLFFDITDKKIFVYGAGRIATRRVETLLAFAPSLTVAAPEASETIREAERAGKLTYRESCYAEGSIPDDAWMVLAATDDAAVNEAIWHECKAKGILVNVCSDRKLCDFQFPGIAFQENLVIGVNAGGNDHRLARSWTEKIQKEVAEEWKET